MKYSSDDRSMMANTTEKSLKENHKICMSIVVPFLQIFDTFNYMNELINVANKEKFDFWSLEEYYNPIEALFLLCKVEDENHKDILYNVIFTNASKRLGDKDFKGRAKYILTQLEKTSRMLSTTKAIA